MTLDLDLVFVIGLIVCILSVPAFLGAYSEGRSLRAGMILVIVGAGLIAFAVVQTPLGTYSATKIPEIFTKVAGSILH
ncbi:hypothetical protein [Aliiruegeria lutimaris]|uniref:Uncharacterized protein n=1 Tax=Aliiruegeria lutimaris TaxID=571298 RepID=A0A1G8P2K9_9RHOB|nr:hypothetical protein [Aliiruegeria lutimaris]SDI86717.1 hypothetical protein SAMN04488026_100853 [Aliiruegeria lutimaris]